MEEKRYAQNSPSGEQPKKRGKAKVIVIGVIIALVAALGLSAYLLHRSAQRVRTEAATLVETLDTLESALTSGNPETLRSTVAKVNAAATTIHNETKGPLWAIAEYLPSVGGDVKVVRTLSDVLLDVSENALNPIADNAELLSPEDLIANFDTIGASLEQLITLVRTIHPVITRSVETVNGLPTPTFTEISALKDQTDEVLTSVDETLTLVESGLELLGAITG